MCIVTHCTCEIRFIVLHWLVMFQLQTNATHARLNFSSILSLVSKSGIKHRFAIVKRNATEMTHINVIIREWTDRRHNHYDQPITHLQNILQVSPLLKPNPIHHRNELVRD